MAVAFAFDAHDDTLSAIVEAAFDANAVAFLEVELAGFEIGDMFLTVLCDRDEVFHRPCRNGEVVFTIGESGAFDEDGMGGSLTIGFKIIERPLGKKETCEGGDELTFFATTDGFDFIGERNKRFEARFTGLVAYFYFLPRASAAERIPDFEFVQSREQLIVNSI